jgi:hypothetical protein
LELLHWRHRSPSSSDTGALDREISQKSVVSDLYAKLVVEILVTEVP